MADTNPIDELFQQETTPAAEQTQQREQTRQTGTATERPPWVPENFWTEGKLNAEGLAKSWNDTRAELTRSQQRVKELEAARGGEKLPEAADIYWQGTDFAAVREASPKAFADMGGGEGPSVQGFLRAAHKQGLGPEAARTMLGEYLAGREAGLDDSVLLSPAERTKRAVAAQGPNGPAVVEQTQGWLKEQHARGVFNDGQMKVLKTLVQSGDGLSLLNTLRQTGTASRSGPPTTDKGLVDVDSEEKAVLEAMKDPNWRRDPTKKADIERRFEQVRQRGGFKSQTAPDGPPKGAWGAMAS